MRVKCAYCGRVNRLVGVPLSFRQRRILKAIADLERDNRALPLAEQIATKIGVGLSTTKNELVHLEHIKEVHRPNGTRSGWAIAEAEEEMHAVPA